MAIHNTNSAFPSGSNDSSGMDLRDWFAGQAVPTLIVENKDHRWSDRAVAAEAYRLADELMTARSRA